jgi:preprotein translocase SecE subunit
VARNRQRAKDRKRKSKEQEPISDSAFDGATAPGSPAPGIIPGQQGIAPADAIPELDDPQAGDAALLEAEEEASAQSPELIPEEALEQPEPPARRGGPRFVQFLKACWAELQRVQWPDRQQVIQATAVVLGFVVVAGAYLGAADFAAKKLMEFIL